MRSSRSAHAATIANVRSVLPPSAMTILRTVSGGSAVKHASVFSMSRSSLRQGITTMAAEGTLRSPVAAVDMALNSCLSEAREGLEGFEKLAATLSGRGQVGSRDIH